MTTQIDMYIALFIEALQQNLPAWVIGWFLPLPILLFYALLLRPWVRKVSNNILYIGFVYLLSIATGILVSTTQDISDMDGATLAGIYAPIVYGAVVALVIATVQLVGRMLGLKTNTRPIRGFRMILRVIVGGFLGTIIGFLVGATIGFTILTLLATQLLPTILLYTIDADSVFTAMVIDQLINLSTYTTGFLGLIIGLGWGIRANAPFEDRSYNGWYLREFRPSDQTAVSKLLNDMKRQRLAYVDDLLERDLNDIYAHYTAQGESFIVAFNNDEHVIGCGALVATENSAYVSRITHLILAQDEERPEVAQSLVRGLIKLSNQRGFRRVLVEIPEEWDTAVRLYKQMGFTADQRGFDSSIGGAKLRLLID